MHTVLRGGDALAGVLRACRVSPFRRFTMRYFRNIEMIQNQDPESLWYLDENTKRLVLVSDDEYIWEPFYENDASFEEIPNPF